MKNEEYKKIREIFAQIPELELHSKKGAKFFFPFYMTEKLQKAEIEVLDLSVRSHHCLKRSGIDTIGLLCEKIVAGENLASIRGCGKTSVMEIMDKLFAYHFYQLKPEKRAEYLIAVLERNLP